MRRFGIFLIVMAAGSAILPFLGMQFIVMSWVDSWGTTVGWVIRAAVLALGIVLAVAGGTQATPSQAPPAGSARSLRDSLFDEFRIPRSEFPVPATPRLDTRMIIWYFSSERVLLADGGRLCAIHEKRPFGEPLGR